MLSSCHYFTLEMMFSKFLCTSVEFTLYIIAWLIVISNISSEKLNTVRTVYTVDPRYLRRMHTTTPGICGGCVPQPPRIAQTPKKPSKNPYT